MDIPELDRRPLKSRDWRIMQRVASMLVTRGASPNSISIFGMICGVLAGLAFALTSHSLVTWGSMPTRFLWLVAALLILGRALGNIFDGMVAVEQGKTSAVGELFNEVPDRVSDAAIMMGAGFAIGGNVVLGFAAALGSVFTAYIRAMGKAATGRNDFRGPMAKPMRMAILVGYCLIAFLAPSQWWMKPVLGPFPLLSLALVIVAVGCLYTSCRRLSGIARQLNSRDSA